MGDAVFHSIFGTTSACAENTFKVTFYCEYERNYLRVRGEYHVSMKPLITSRELPPRARRIPNLSDD